MSNPSKNERERDKITSGRSKSGWWWCNSNGCTNPTHMAPDEKCVLCGSAKPANYGR